MGVHDTDSPVHGSARLAGLTAELSAALLSAILDSSSDYVFVKDTRLRTIFCNARFARAQGKTAAEMYGKTDIENGWDPELVRGNPAKGIKGWETDDREALAGRTVRAAREPSNIQGEIRYFDTVKTPIRGEHSEIIGFLGFGRDVTEQVRAESDLRASEEKLERERDLLRAVIDGLPDLVFVKDRQSRYVLVNRSLAELSGGFDPEDLVGKSDFDYVPSALAEKYTADDRVVMETGRSQINTEELSMLGSGTSRWVLTTKVPLVDKRGEVTGLVGISRDITERKEFEARMLQTQKLESLGVLAGGIAHDFNNILMTILGNADMAREGVPAAAPAADSLQEISRAAQRASDLCRQMLAYSGKGQFEVQALDLGEVVREMAEMLRMSVSRRVTLNYVLASGLPSIRADLSQLRQVIMNLVINASEAIGETNGVIGLATGTVDFDEAPAGAAWSDGPPRAGLYVSMEVTDTGCGMDEATRARIFEPFFTTKFTGRGLGLSAVMGIVRGHGGAIRVSSEPAKGTTFTLLFPAAEAHAEPLRRAAGACGEWQGHGTLLLVDDEESIRRVGRTMLEHLGFCVLAAADGLQAVQALREHGEEITCVLLDLTMPSMDGEEAFRQMRAIRPDLKVILASGYNEQSAVRQFVGQGLAGFIQKPFQLSTLELKLREILGD